MRDYESPVLLRAEEMTEGVYLASGSATGGTCYTATANIHQTPQDGRSDYRIQVDGVHSADHTRTQQTLTLTFNQPVTYVSSNGTLVSGDHSSSLEILYTYMQNPTDNIGLGDVVVQADPGLAVTGVQITD